MQISGILSRIMNIWPSESPAPQAISIDALQNGPGGDGASPPPVNPGLWTYSDQYIDIMEEGHSKPPPSFGSPTFVMHLGIWQKYQSGDIKQGPDRAPIESRFLYHDVHNERFFKEVTTFVEALQRRGRVLKSAKGPSGEEASERNIDRFSFTEYQAHAGTHALNVSERKGAYKFKDYQPQSLAFNLWWQDSDEHGNPLPNNRVTKPDYSALRVRVQVQTHLDHVTISFFIDAAKPYGDPQIYTTAKRTGPAFGYRRRRIALALEKLRKVSEDQISQGLVDRDRLPERGISEADAKELLEIANYFYEGIWNDFKQSFGIEASLPAGLDGVQGEGFADLRGVMMSIRGLDTAANARRAQAAQALRTRLKVAEPLDGLERSANAGIGPFEMFDQKCNEPNAVLKSLWPFLRRMAPWADYRDFIGCGLLDWRALYLTPLGASGSLYEDEEAPGRAVEVKSLNLPPEPEGHLAGDHPVRYLVLTKGEPHREQIGRFIERINALETKRLFALKNLSTVKNAGVHLRLLGRELDGVLQRWGDERKQIEDWHRWEFYTLENPEIAAAIEAQIKTRKAKGTPLDYGAMNEAAQALEDLRDQQTGQTRRQATAQDYVRRLRDLLAGTDQTIEQLIELTSNRRKQEVMSDQKQDLGDRRVKKLSTLVKDIEQRLVGIGAALDNIGNGGAGRILYVTGRAKYHIEEFERMVPTLEIGNVDGWIHYGQFVQRNVMPTFNRIRNVGDRLISLRQRLQSITDMIQTSALIVETEATRANTETLRRIVSNLYFMSIPIWIISSTLLVNTVFPEDWTLRLIVIVAVGCYFSWRYVSDRRKEEAHKDQ